MAVIVNYDDSYQCAYTLYVYIREFRKFGFMPEGIWMHMNPTGPTSLDRVAMADR